MQRMYQVLERVFGYQKFREGQKELVEAILSGRDVAGIMPTGAGKSICFQLPALLLSGITLVVSPLISLMKDQVGALIQNGVRAAYLNSSLTARQYRLALDNASHGVYKIIYVAPERLMTEAFQKFAQTADISMLTVDEAHCVSQWGQDFRPSYLEIPTFLGTLPHRPIVSAFTATATPQVREDIITLLGLREPFVKLTGFDRKNLSFEVQRPQSKQGALTRLLTELSGRSGIIYCSTRKAVEEVCEFLQRRGLAATRYHAGLSDEERKKNQEDFLFDRCPVMVATNAFGMGIDKSNVSFVIHYNMPKDLESYYQEAGRAGRDGEEARCILLYSGRDVITNQFLIDHAEENEGLTESQRNAVRQQSQNRLREMTFYATTSDCLRGFILRYFGETAPSYCGNCSNCLQNFEEVDVSAVAKKILRCVAATGERYGIKLMVDTLRGKETDRTQATALIHSEQFGALRDQSEKRLREIIQALLQVGALRQSQGEYPVLELDGRANDYLTEKKPLLLKLVKEEQRPTRGNRTEQEPVDPELFEALRAVRVEIAKVQGVPAFVVFTDATLRDMCMKVPADLGQLLEVQGVGVNKAERYGAKFLAAISTYRAKNSEKKSERAL